MTQVLAYRRHTGVTFVRPSGVGFVGLLMLVVGAWAAIVGFIGPLFGYHATTTAAWSWTRSNWLMHLLPGVVAFGAGLLALSHARSVSVWRGSLATAGLLAIGAGAWLVIGPTASVLFESTRVYGPSTGAWAAFANEVGANLGPGVLLVALGGMALKSAVAERMVQLPADAGPAPAPAPEAAAPPPAPEVAAPSPTATDVPTDAGPSGVPPWPQGG